MTELAPAATPHLDRSRIKRMRAAHSYWAVLGAIFVTFFLAALLPDSAWATSLIVLAQSATLLIVIWTAGWAMTERTVPFATATIAGFAAAVNIFWQGKALTAALAIVAGVMSVAIAVAIGQGAVAQNEVNSRSV